MFKGKIEITAMVFAVLADERLGLTAELQRARDEAADAQKIGKIESSLSGNRDEWFRRLDNLETTTFDRIDLPKDELLAIFMADLAIAEEHTPCSNGWGLDMAIQMVEQRLSPAHGRLAAIWRMTLDGLAERNAPLDAMLITKLAILNAIRREQTPDQPAIDSLINEIKSAALQIDEAKRRSRVLSWLLRQAGIVARRTGNYPLASEMQELAAETATDRANKTMYRFLSLVEQHNQAVFTGSDNTPFTAQALDDAYDDVMEAMGKGHDWAPNPPIHVVWAWWLADLRGPQDEVLIEQTIGLSGKQAEVFVDWITLIQAIRAERHGDHIAATEFALRIIETAKGDEIRASAYVLLGNLAVTEDEQASYYLLGSRANKSEGHQVAKLAERKLQSLLQR